MQVRISNAAKEELRRNLPGFHVPVAVRFVPTVLYEVWLQSACVRPTLHKFENVAD